MAPRRLATEVASAPPARGAPSGTQRPARDAQQQRRLRRAAAAQAATSAIAGSWREAGDRDEPPSTPPRLEPIVNSGTSRLLASVSK